MTKQLSLALVIGSILVFQGCAHKAVEKQLDEEMKNQSAVGSSSDIRAEAHRLIEESQTLTPEQKAKLLDLQKRTGEQMKQFTQDSLKLRSMLVQDLVKPDYSESEINVIKNRLTKIENQRLSTLFSAVDQANTILGRNNPSNSRLLGSFYDSVSPWMR